jgi:hypothetical protein
LRPGGKLSGEIAREETGKVCRTLVHTRDGERASGSSCRNQRRHGRFVRNNQEIKSAEMDEDTVLSMGTAPKALSLGPLVRLPDMIEMLSFICISDKPWMFHFSVSIAHAIFEAN